MTRGPYPVAGTAKVVPVSKMLLELLGIVEMFVTYLAVLVVGTADPVVDHGPVGGEFQVAGVTHSMGAGISFV